MQTDQGVAIGAWAASIGRFGRRRQILPGWLATPATPHCLKVVVATGAVIATWLQAAVLETTSRSRTDRGRCGRAFRSAQRCHGPGGRPASRESRRGRISDASRWPQKQGWSSCLLNLVIVASCWLAAMA